jgi:hypothetical protein
MLTCWVIFSAVLRLIFLLTFDPRGVIRRFAYYGSRKCQEPRHFSPHLIKYSVRNGFLWFLARNIIFFIIISGVGLSPWYCGHFWPIVQAPDDRWGWLWSNWRNEDWQGKPKYSDKTCPGATLSTTNPTWPDPGSNPGPQRWEASD